MPTAIVTGSGGLIGSESVRQLIDRGYDVVGVDNDMRRSFFGEEASTKRVSKQLIRDYADSFHWMEADIRDAETMSFAFGRWKPEIVVHCAAQPSHDWAAKDPQTDFGVNAVGTLNLLEAHRLHVPDSTFIHCSTSKVYGDNPNLLPLEIWKAGKRIDRYDLPVGHQYYDGIDTTMSIDGCLHSLFGVSKASGDLLVQEYGRYFDIPTVCFRPGCLTGEDHAGTELHGFLAYLMICAVTERPYNIYGYDGLQVRCNIHATDLVKAFMAFHAEPLLGGKVYNIGGGRENSVSMNEAIHMCQRLVGYDMDVTYVDQARIGDHKWWISSNEAFKDDYPDWDLEVSIIDILTRIRDEHEI